MTNETTYLENLLNNRKVVRSYQKASFDKNSLEDVAKYAVKIPTAGFSRGIEILNTFDTKKIKTVSQIFNEDSFKKDNQSPWISNSLGLFFLLLNEDEYHKRYSSSDKKNAVNSKEWDIQEQGFATGFMGLHSIDRKKIHDLFKIPHDYQIVGMVTAGVENDNIVNSKKQNIKKKLTHNEFFSK